MGVVVVSWNLQRPGRRQWDALLEQLELEEPWDIILWQESLAPGPDELLQFDFGAGDIASSAVRGHTIFVARSGAAVVVHRKWSSAVQAVLGGGCYVGVVFAAGPDSSGVATANVHMPSSWCDDPEFQTSMGQLDLFWDEVRVLGNPRPRVLVGGDWNVVLGTMSPRSESVEAWAEQRGLRPKVPPGWTLRFRWRHPSTGAISLRAIDAFLAPREWEFSTYCEVLHRAHVRSDPRPIVIRVRAQIGSLWCFKLSRPRLTGWRPSEPESDIIGHRLLRAMGAAVSCRSFQDALTTEAGRIDPWEFIRTRTISKPPNTERPPDKQQESAASPWDQRIVSLVQKLATFRDQLLYPRGV